MIDADLSGPNALLSQSKDGIQLSEKLITSFLKQAYCVHIFLKGSCPETCAVKSKDNWEAALQESLQESQLGLLEG